MKNNLLVTGAAGFIGLNFIEYVSKLDKYNIFVVDKLTYTSYAGAEKIFRDNNVKHFKMDINDITIDLMKDLDIKGIINFAAESHVDSSIEGPEIFVKSNINGLFNLLEISRILKIKLHQVSTDEVYGDLPLDKPELLFDETWSINPSSPYSATKASADLLIQAYVRTYGIKATITRCSNNFGIYQDKSSLIPKVINNIYNGIKVPLYGSGLNVRDWLFVEDHCSAILFVFENFIDGVYNVGGNNELSNIKVIETIANKMRVKPEDVIEYVEDRKGHDLRYAIDSSKLKKLGWLPKYTLENKLDEVIKFYSK